MILLRFLKPFQTTNGRLRFIGTPPRKQTSGSNGYDLTAWLEKDGRPRTVELRNPKNHSALMTARGTDLFPDRLSVTLPAGYRALVPTGIWTELPEGTDAQLRPRSGLAWKHGITVLNAPGTIDPDFEGEWHLMLVNTSSEPFEIIHGERLAQVVFGQALEVNDWDGAVEFDAAKVRGDGGYGSTGA